MYLMGAIEKYATQIASYAQLFNSRRLSKATIILPTLDKLDINSPYSMDGFVPDWDYMQEKIAELEQYLIAAGLNDYELTDEDREALATKLKVGGVSSGNTISSAGCLKEIREFVINDVFELKKGKRLTKKEQSSGNIPFIGSTDSNNGVTAYIGQQPIFPKNAITISYNGSVGQVFYQEEPFWASDDINVLYLRKHELNEKLFGYLGTALKKSGQYFTYSFKWNIERMKQTVIPLPIQTDISGNPVIDPDKTYHQDGFVPDWKYMENYIRAIEKVVIADVVDWKDKVIEKTKKVVED